jgi:hypothetical protein
MPPQPKPRAFVPEIPVKKPRGNVAPEPGIQATPLERLAALERVARH